MRSKVTYILGDIINKLFPFLLIPYLTNRLGVNDYSVIIVLESYIAAIIVVMNFGQDSVILKSKYKMRNTTLEYMFCNMLLWTFLVMLIGLFFLFLSGFSWNLFIVLIVSLATTIYVFQMTYLLSRKKAKKYFLFQNMNLMVSTLCTVVFFELYSSSVEVRFTSILASMTLVIFLLSYILKFNIPKLKLSRLKKFFFYQVLVGAPLMLHQLAFFLRTRGANTLFSDSGTFNEFANFGLASQLSLAIPLLCAAVYKSEAINIFSKLKSKTFNPADNRLNYLLVLFVVVVSLLTFILPSSFYKFIFGNDFSNLGSFLPYSILVYCLYPLYLKYHNIAIYLDFSTQITLSALTGIIFSVTLLALILNFSLDMRFAYLSIMVASLLGIFSVKPFMHYHRKKYYVKSN